MRPVAESIHVFSLAAFLVSTGATGEEYVGTPGDGDTGTGFGVDAT